MIQNAWNWVLAHQVTVGLIIAVLIQVINAATTIWTDHPKAVKWLTFLISVLSIVRSRGAATAPGLLGALKFPLVPELPTKEPTAPSGTAGTITTMLALVVLTTGCPSASTGTTFDPATALNTACAFEPAVNVLVTVGVCNNLKEPAKSICLKVAAIAHAIGPAVLVGVGALYDACRGATPRALPKELNTAPASQPAVSPSPPTSHSAKALSPKVTK
jgi:hypothetical protein